MTECQRHPTIHDYCALAGLRLSKRRKTRYDPNVAEVFYDEHFEPRHLLAYRDDVRSSLRRQEISRVFDRLPANRLVLDVGCGVGDILRVVAPRHRAVGVEYAAASLHLARRNGLTIPLVQGSALALPFLDATVDAIICLEVLEHIEHDEHALAEFRRVIRAGGYLVLSVPSSFYFGEYLSLMGHYRHYTPESLAVCLQDSGFAIEQFFPQYPVTNVLHLYTYWFLVSANLLLQRIRRDDRTIFEREIRQSVRFYVRIVAPLFFAIARTERSIGKHSRLGSTFVLARKMLP